MVDVKNQSILAYELHPEAVTRLLDDKVDTLFFLIRRLGCKEQALVYLKEIVESKQDLTMLSFIFNKFSEIYKKAQEERYFLGSYVESYLIGRQSKTCQHCKLTHHISIII